MDQWIPGALCYLANEMARLCEAVGADARELEQGLRSERRIGEKAYIRPGSAFAGGTLARDVVALTVIAREHGKEVELLPAILRSNEKHKEWPLHRLECFYSNLNGRTIAVLGLSYKPAPTRFGAVLRLNSAGPCLIRVPR